MNRTERWVLAVLVVGYLTWSSTGLAWKPISTRGWTHHPFGRAARDTLDHTIGRRYPVVSLDVHHLALASALIATGLVLAAVAWHYRPARARSSTRETRTGGRWHKAENLSAALVDAGVLAPRDGLAPRITYRGKVGSNEFGEWVTVALPIDKTIDDVRKGHARLASWCRVPMSQLTLTQPDDAPPNVVTIWVGKELPKIGSGRTNAVTHVERTVWGTPVVIGRSPRGDDVTFAVAGQHSLIVGATNSGKTVAARTILAHALLDPDVTVWAVSGKGESADWDAMAPLCRRYIGVVDDAMPAAVEEMLGDVERYADQIRSASRAAGRGQPSGLLLLEEWPRIRAQAESVGGAPTLERLDKSLATILATARSAGVHVLLLAQRATADNVSTSQSANVTQRMVLRVSRKGDTALALGDKAEHQPPRRRGQALITDTESGERSVLLDNLSDEDWERICDRASKLRPLPPRRPTAEPVGVDPLLARVIEALREPGQLTPTELFEALDEADRPTSSAVLGKMLSARGLTSQMVAKRRVYLLETALETAGSAVSDAVV